jgi:hypothetical protein
MPASHPWPPERGDQGQAAIGAGKPGGNHARRLHVRGVQTCVVIGEIANEERQPNSSSVARLLAPDPLWLSPIDYAVQRWLLA